MRTYQKTHPWINFTIDLQKTNPRLWLALGEAQSKCVHLAKVPLKPRIAESLHKLFLAKGISATTAIEGNTLTEEEVLRHIEGKLELPPSKEYLKQEIDNILEACNLITKQIFSQQGEKLTVTQIVTFNKMVLQKLSLADGVIPGEIRNYSVGVARYRGAPAEDCEYLLNAMCEWLNKEFQPIKSYEIVYGLIKAVFAHLYLAWIHPFGDGNGRTARLIEFQILLSVGVPSPAAHLLSNHYNKTRNEYYLHLDQASKSHDEVLKFLEYAVHGFLEGLISQLDMIFMQQWEIAWQNYIYELFRGKTSKTGIRQRHLVLDLSSQSDPVPLAKIRSMSPESAEAYADKTLHTILRDLEKLIAMGLIERKPDGFRAKRENILAFLPPSKIWEKEL